MKALTLHQPWASLVAVGAKMIETRSWRTDYRGPLAIHAGQRPPDAFGAYQGAPTLGNYEVGSLDPGAPRRMWRNDAHEPVIDLPLGAVVASATLIDCVPIEQVCAISPTLTPPWYAIDPHHPIAEGGRFTYGARHDQLDYGDFSDGRFAWLLGDVAATTQRCPWCWGKGTLCADCEVGSREAHPLHNDDSQPCPVCEGRGTCDPVPARGRQGLWNWTPEKVAA